jgi:hypothetical protein
MTRNLGGSEMNEELLKDIKSAGYWRINFRPVSALAEKLTMDKCKEAVFASNVSLRGWDYPHLPLGKDGSSGLEYGDEFIEAWTSFMFFREFWRIYRSGQFLHYRGMWEDREEFPNKPQDPFISIIEVIYLFTEITEFASRLANALALEKGLSITISAHNTAGRRLYVGQGRMNFFQPKTTVADQITVEAILPLDGSKTPQQVALSLSKDVFDRFGWNPSNDQIEADQLRLLRRQF